MVKWLKKLNELNGHMGDLNAEFQPSLRDLGLSAWTLRLLYIVKDSRA
jgi:hypothetical protein